MYSVNHNWDPLKVCAVGKTYPPEFYKFIKNKAAREVMQQISVETNEDLHQLEQLLISFGVKVFRPDIKSNDVNDYIMPNGKIMAPPLALGDISATINNKFYFGALPPAAGAHQFNIVPKLVAQVRKEWDSIKGTSWPSTPPASIDEFKALPTSVIDEINALSRDLPFMFEEFSVYYSQIENRHINFVFKDKMNMIFWETLLDDVKQNGNEIIYGTGVANAITFMLSPTELIHSTHISINLDCTLSEIYYNKLFPNHTNTVFDINGHIDGVFTLPKPGVIISSPDYVEMAKTLPGANNIIVSSRTTDDVLAVRRAILLNKGKWSVPAVMGNTDTVSDFLVTNAPEWVGYVSESEFGVNNIVIDASNIIASSVTAPVKELLSNHNINVHVTPFRHQYFWDNGLHCVASSVHRS